MTFLVINCGHRHGTVSEARRCVFPPPVPKPYVPVRDWKDDAGTMSRRQHGYLVHTLGVDPSSRLLRSANSKRRKSLSMNEASRLIDDIKSGKVRVKSMTEATIEEPRHERPTRESAQATFIKEMIGDIPSGCFAVRPDESSPFTFLRISRPKRGSFAESIKIQSQHGPNYETRMVLWPSGRLSVYSESYLDKVLLVIVDYQGSAISYSRELGRCARCNTELTDPRSIFYGIGPECETQWTWFIPRVEEEKGAYVPMHEEA